MSKKNEVILVKIPVGLNSEVMFEQLLTNIHDTMIGEPIGLEIVSKDQHIYFYVRASKSMKSAIDGQIYAKYPNAEIFPVKNGDYINREAISKQGFAAAEVVLKRKDIYPIKTHTEFDGDSLAGILAILSKAEGGEQIWVQVVIKPLADNWKLNFGRSIQMKVDRIGRILRLGERFKMKGVKALRDEQKSAMNAKADKFVFDTNIRVGYVAQTKSAASVKLNALIKSFTQYNTIDYNGFAAKNISKEALISGIQNLSLRKPYRFNSDEISTVYHFPDPDIVPHIVYVTSKKAQPPQDLPKRGQFGIDEMSLFATTNYHNQNTPFGIKRIDRRRHLYVVGKSGTGKSKFLELLMISDILAGKGVGVLDPHGDLVDNVLKYIPESRMKDVIIFDPGDMEYPIAFNPLEEVPPEMRIRVTIGFVEIFKKLFASNWTPRLEHVLRYTTLALLDTPGTTVLSILKMLSDKNYRQMIVANIDDSVVKNFWVNEFAGWSEKFDSEAIMPLLNKVGQFVSTSLIRNIIGQPKNKIDFRDIMDNQKILLCKVSKGALGEENCGLLGAMIVTKIQQAAMSRMDTPEEERKDFYLYCDEFQYFATDTFAEILSEARKYRLNVTMAHQYMGQLSDLVKTTVFGNVGSMINFRVGAEDAAYLEQEYTPRFNVRDIINLGVREMYIKMSVDGQIRDAFSARTINVPNPKKDLTKEILDFSRKTYARPVKEVEDILKRWEENADEAHQSINPKDLGEPEFEQPLI